MTIQVGVGAQIDLPALRGRPCPSRTAVVRHEWKAQFHFSIGGWALDDVDPEGHAMGQLSLANALHGLRDAEARTIALDLLGTDFARKFLGAASRQEEGAAITFAAQGVVGADLQGAAERVTRAMDRQEWLVG